MAQKILVTTDLSPNSKAGIRFAIQLARQTRSSLIFYYAVELLKPTRWSDVKYREYQQRELETLHANLLKFVQNIYGQSGVRPGKFECVVQKAAPVERAVIKFAKEIKAHYICMATRGAGTLKKLLGTTASRILTTSPIPVFVVPKSYSRGKVSNILYASDLNDLRPELKQVTRFAATLKARISVYHYDYLIELPEARQKLKKIADRYKAPDIKFVFQKLDIEYPLSAHIKKGIRQSKSSLVILFTKQKRDWFERFFLSSKSAALSFDTKTPLLVFPKA